MGKTQTKTYKHEIKKERKTNSGKRIKQERKIVGFPRLSDTRRIDTLFVIISASIVVVLLLFHPEGWLRTVFYAVPFLLLAFPIGRNAWTKITDGDYFCSEILALLAVVILFILGDCFEATLFLFLFIFVSRLEQHLDKRGKQELDGMLDILPVSAQLITENGIATVSPEELELGDVILVSAGERIPIDGIIVKGITTIDTAAISGQRSPWAVNEGYRVYSGCMNLTSDVQIRVTRRFEQTTVRNVVNIARSAETFPSSQCHQAHRYQMLLIPFVLVIFVIVVIGVSLFWGTWTEQLRRGAILLILACPMVKDFAIPLCYRKGLSLSVRMGVFSKGMDCFESLARAETVIFDKTGTITEGRYTVTDVFPAHMSEQQLLTIAATAESHSHHPIAIAIREAAGKTDKRLIGAMRTKEIPGRGIEAAVGERVIYVGNAALLEEHGVKYSIPSRPGTAIHVAVDARYCGHILISDKVRKRAFDALEGLRVNGVKKLVLLTGDVFSSARPLASRLNFDMLRAELKPEGKAKAVDYLMKNKTERSSIAFIGEGENDTKIMTKADVGISMGSLGSDAALVAADVMIMDRDIMKIPRMVNISRKVYLVSRLNFFVGAGMNLLMILFAVFGVLSVPAAESITVLLALALLFHPVRIQ